MKLSPSPRTRACLAVARIAGLLFLASATAACGDTQEQERERARRARQMRDVVRMLDAMETADPAAVALALGPAAAAPTRPVPRSERSATTTPASDSTWPPARASWFATGAAGVAIAGSLIFLVRRRRTKAAPPADVPSIAGFFAEPPPEPLPATASLPQAPSAPAWVYGRSSFETPNLEVIADPVDLLVPHVATRQSLSAAVETRARPVEPGLRERLARADPGAVVHLVGDERFPDIRCTGSAVDALEAWQDILATVAVRDDNDGRLARWLLPAVHLLRADGLPKQEAERLRHDAEHLAIEAIDIGSTSDGGHGFARWIRMRLARAGRLSGATRLFALRELLARVNADPRFDGEQVLDASIDVHLAWSSWLYGEAALARLVTAEEACDRLAAAGPDAATRSLRRRGEVWLHRARLQKAPARLADLERAQALLDDAHDRLPNAETALLVATTARQRASLLAGGDAGAACSHALMHAFLAEQDPAWRVDALVCRLDIQLTYDALSDQTVAGGVTAALGRSLEAAGPVPSAARLTVAEARLHHGDGAGTARMCEAIWRDDPVDPRVLTLWRDACDTWAADPGHDAPALARALRRLAIARSTS